VSDRVPSAHGGREAATALKLIGKTSVKVNDETCESRIRPLSRLSRPPLINWLKKGYISGACGKISATKIGGRTCEPSCWLLG
jgi:hypothetical protein